MTISKGKSFKLPHKSDQIEYFTHSLEMCNQYFGVQQNYTPMNMVNLASQCPQNLDQNQTLEFSSQPHFYMTNKPDSEAALTCSYSANMDIYNHNAFSFQNDQELCERAKNMQRDVLTKYLESG